MTRKENITVILECYFTGFKKEIIDSACNRILEQESKTDIGLNDKKKLSWLGKNCKDCGNEKCKKLGTLPKGYDCALWQPKGIKMVTNAKEAENYPISEDISKGIEEIIKLIFENGQAESEKINMADIELVIKIPRKWFDDMVREEFTEVDELCAVIQHGIILPRGHGRLIGADAVYGQISKMIDSTPTIIEADEKEEE